MEQLKHCQEIIALGKKLIKEFSTHDQRDTTLCWMAHYLSELMVSIENEADIITKRKLQENACQIILGIWKNRNDFPHETRPLASLSSTVEVINSFKKKDLSNSYWERLNQDSSEWGNFAETLKKSSELAFSLTILASTGNDLLLKEKEWSIFPNLLSKEENEIIDYLDQLKESQQRRNKIELPTSRKKKKEKIEHLFDRIEKILNDQMDKFIKLKSSTLNKGG